VVENKSAEALAEKVRTGLHQARTCPAVEWAYAALDTLLARIANYERYVEREIEPKLLARLAETEAGAKWQYEMGKEWRQRCLAAEEERDRYRDALERIVGTNYTGTVPAHLSSAQRIGYAALWPEQP
jgi:hypothetical protein